MKGTLALLFRLSVGFGLVLTMPAQAQKQSITPDLESLAQGQGGTAVNRGVTLVADGPMKGIRLDDRPGDGVVWLKDVQLTNGVLEFDVRGKDVLQQSFVGVAFHGLDDKTYEAIYFRPFNFRSTDSVRRIHAVQYIAQPTYTWQKLRAEFPDKYESAVSPAPDPTGWFHVRVELAAPAVRVFVNNESAPVLVVNQLTAINTGKVGLWVGNNSGGDFANLVITSAP